jgi:hypothetical protein
VARREEERDKNDHRIPNLPIITGKRYNFWANPILFILSILSKKSPHPKLFSPPFIFGLKSQICNRWEVLQASENVLNCRQFFEMKNGSKGLSWP